MELENAKGSRWVCTLCSVTMTAKDVMPHKAGRRHTMALSEVCQESREQVESECFQEKATEATRRSTKTNLLPATLAAYYPRLYLLGKTDVARPASLFQGTTDSRASINTTQKGQESKAKVSPKPRKRGQKGSPELELNQVTILANFSKSTQRVATLVTLSTTEPAKDMSDIWIMDISMSMS